MRSVSLLRKDKKHLFLPYYYRFTFFSRISISQYCTNEMNIDKFRKAIEWRSKERGMLETELIFRSFNKKYLHTLTLPQLQQYHALLQQNEPDIWNWLSGRTPVPDEVNNEIFRMIKAHMNDFRNFIKERSEV